MRITLSPELAAFVKEKVDAGRYQTQSEAIHDGLRLLKEMDAVEFQRLRSLLKVRATESRRGDSVLFDKKLREQIRRRGMMRLAAIKKRKS
ncbi:MAG: type II toxin-antitoxin system ParD family antitoxin [Tepidisphaeraceae bacterium]